MTGRAMTRRVTARRPLAAVVIMIVSALVVSACSGPSDSTSGEGGGPVSALLLEHDLVGLDAAQVIERLDTMPVADRPADLMASVRPDELVLSNGDGVETSLPMPRDEVYVSVAPYVEQTHECHFHSLTTCLGELTGAEVDVELVGEDGRVLVEETRTTFDNGFVGLWVPRGIRATLTIRQGERTATAEVSTRDDQDPTCVTTMRLT